MSNSRPTQSERVLQYMTKYGSITQIDALNDLGVMRLASRISELRKNGHPIESRVETVRNQWNEPCYIKRYSLKADEGVADNGGN